MLSARRLLLAASVALLFGAAAWQARPPAGAGTEWSRLPPELKPLLWPEPRPPAEFSLNDSRGGTFTASDFTGEWNLVFFGYLQCPDVCPTTLSVLRALRRGLLQHAPEQAEARFIFVSVDPSHDRPQAMAPYLAFFDPSFIGLSGSAEQLQPLLQSWAIMAVEVTGPDGRRSIDHTSSIILIDPQGRAVGALPPPHQPERMLSQFLQIQQHFAR